MVLDRIAPVHVAARSDGDDGSRSRPALGGGAAWSLDVTGARRGVRGSHRIMVRTVRGAETRRRPISLTGVLGELLGELLGDLFNEIGDRISQRVA